MALPLMLIPPAVAFELPFDKGGDLSGSLDVTMSAGAAYRTEAPDWSPDSAGTPGSTIQKSNTTFDERKIVQTAGTIMGELDLRFRNYGFKSSGSYSYDLFIMNRDTQRTGTIADTGLGNDWAEDAEAASGSVFELLDAYAYGTFEPGDTILDLRLGKQVINWGEGLFFFDGVSQQVPLNINKLSIPGTELKEAYIGVPAIYGQLAATSAVSVEAYYQFKWYKNQFPGVGTFYGDDLLGPGAEEEWRNWMSADPVNGFPQFRLDDVDADDQGQWGLSARFLIGNYELGAYYSHYHDYMPLVQFSDNKALETLTGFVGFFPGLSLAQYYPEDLNMYGVSVSTNLGPVSINGEVAYRPDRPLFSDMNAFLGLKNGINSEEHDTWNASVHGLWMAGRGLGFDDHFVGVQVGLDHVEGDLSGLTPHNEITKNATAKVARSAWGVAGSWDARWLNVLPAVDVTFSNYLQYDFSGNSHFWGNFAEDRLMGSHGFIFNIGQAWETAITYAWVSLDDSNFDCRDTVSAYVNYKF